MQLLYSRHRGKREKKKEGRERERKGERKRRGGKEMRRHNVGKNTEGFLFFFLNLSLHGSTTFLLSVLCTHTITKLEMLSHSY